MSKLLNKAEFWFVVILAGGITYIFKAFVAESAPVAICALPGLTLLIPYLLENADEQPKAVAPPVRAENGKDEVAAQISLLRNDILARLERLEIQEKSIPIHAENLRADPPPKLGELSGALSEAMKQISSRDSQIDLLTKNVNQANIQRNLVRLAQSLEIARSLQARVTAGKSDPKQSLDFLVDDLDSALTDQGVESMEIAVGAKVADLAAGSFAAISVVDAPDDALRGTVKEVRSRCYFISEAGKKPRFIAPAKVILYRA